MVVRECAKTVAAIGAMAAARTTNIAAEIVAEIILLNMTLPPRASYLDASNTTLHSDRHVAPK
jgi:hypothetical protein